MPPLTGLLVFVGVRFYNYAAPTALGFPRNALRMPPGATGRGEASAKPRQG
jgi:hypothetical protein